MENKGIAYHFKELSHTVCLDKVELLKGHVNSRKRLLKDLTEQEEKEIIENVIMSLDKALDVVK
jgi:hypothetical protein